jgi:hypothetical protein
MTAATYRRAETCSKLPAKACNLKEKELAREGIGSLVQEKEGQQARQVGLDVVTPATRYTEGD